MMLPNKRVLAQYLKQQREKRGLSYRGVGKDTGLHHNTVKELEKGEKECTYVAFYMLVEYYKNKQQKS